MQAPERDGEGIITVVPIREFCCKNGHIFEQLIPQREFSNSENCPVDGCGAESHVIPSAFATPNTAIHASERPVVLRNRKTGEIRYLADRDTPVHPKYAARGFVKEEAFTSFSERDAFEKSTGRIHERSHYDPGSATAERDLTPPDPQQNLEKFKLSRVPARV